MVLISEADGSLLPKATHVKGDWKRELKDIRTPPLVTVRCNPVDIIPSTYCRRLESPATGDIAVFAWTAHVHTSACTIDGEQRGRYVQELADKIIDYLTVQAPNQEAYGIFDIFDISQRESDVAKQPYKFCRVIISGRIHAKRYDNI